MLSDLTLTLYIAAESSSVGGELEGEEEEQSSPVKMLVAVARLMPLHLLLQSKTLGRELCDL